MLSEYLARFPCLVYAALCVNRRSSGREKTKDNFHLHWCKMRVLKNEITKLVLDFSFCFRRWEIGTSCDAKSGGLQAFRIFQLFSLDIQFKETIR